MRTTERPAAGDRVLGVGHGPAGSRSGPEAAADGAETAARRLTGEVVKAQP